MNLFEQKIQLESNWSILMEIVKEIFTFSKKTKWTSLILALALPDELKSIYFLLKYAHFTHKSWPKRKLVLAFQSTMIALLSRTALPCLWVWTHEKLFPFHSINVDIYVCDVVTWNDHLIHQTRTSNHLKSFDFNSILDSILQYVANIVPSSIWTKSMCIHWYMLYLLTIWSSARLSSNLKQIENSTN